MNHPSERERRALFRETLVGEVFYALGLSREGIARRCLGPLFALPAARVAAICARTDAAVATSGLPGGARCILPTPSIQVAARCPERIPCNGPVLIVSNHPGAFDSLALLSSIPRADVGVVISDTPFTRAFVIARPHFIFAPLNAKGRAATMRAAIAHLRKGAALLIFPHGDVEPDPEIGPGAYEEIANWSRSVAILLRAAPETRLVVAIASGVLMPRLARSPVVRIRRTAQRRQKLAAVLQFLLHGIRPDSVRLTIRLSFGEPVEARTLLAPDPMPALIARARRLLTEHLAGFESISGSPGLSPRCPMPPGATRGNARPSRTRRTESGSPA